MGEVYGPDYLRSFKDETLDCIANYIEVMPDKLFTLRQENASLKIQLASARSCSVGLYKENAQLLTTIESSNKVVARLREALEFYGDEKNYDKQGVVVDVQDDGQGDPEWYQDIGSRARKALNPTEETE